jgi:hypothetical protein
MQPLIYITKGKPGKEWTTAYIIVTNMIYKELSQF